MKPIIITGTPGTGKTTLAKLLSKSNGYQYLDVSKFIEKENLIYITRYLIEHPEKFVKKYKNYILEDPNNIFKVFGRVT